MANSKDPFYKEYLRTLRERDEIWEIERNQNWIELEKPYISGYYMYSDLRFDIKNRDDAWVFYKCIELVGGRVWYRDKTFKRKLGKGKYEYIRPEFGVISEETYDKLHPAVRKHFSVISEFNKKWNPYRKQYACRVPSYYFIDKVKPRWITHYKEHDELIAQMEAEVRDKLNGKYFKWYWYRRNGGVKSIAKAHNRSDRRYNKNAVKVNMMFEDYERVEYRYQHKHSAIWEAW